MTCRTQKKRARNWRSSKNNQLFRHERNFRRLEDLFWLQDEIRKRVKALQQTTKGPIESIVIPIEDGDDVNVEWPESWIVVIEQTFKYFTESDDLVCDVLNRRYLKNEGFPSSCCDLDISDNKYYRARDAGLQYARECAIQLGLIKVF